jgi:integrase
MDTVPRLWKNGGPRQYRSRRFFSCCAATDWSVASASTLAEATGRRLGSIRMLRWEDFDFGRCRVIWQADADKKGDHWDIPMPEAIMREVRDFQSRFQDGSGHVFSALSARDGVMDRHLFDKWLSVAEARAGLPKLDGSLWHAYRRKWASERKQLPLKDVAAAGGWKDVTVLLEVYQQADDQSVLAVMTEGRKLRANGVS